MYFFGCEKHHFLLSLLVFSLVAYWTLDCWCFSLVALYCDYCYFSLLLFITALRQKQKWVQRVRQ